MSTARVEFFKVNGQWGWRLRDKRTGKLVPPTRPADFSTKKAAAKDFQRFREQANAVEEVPPPVPVDPPPPDPAPVPDGFTPILIDPGSDA